MLIYINRDKDVKRREEFIKNNAHISDLIRYSAFDKNLIDRDDLIEREIIDKDCPYSKAALANALSHITIWNAVLETGKTACIFEDDAVLCNNFVSEYERIVSSVGEDWDIILFGNNFDSSLKVSLVPDILDSVTRFDNEKFIQNHKEFSKKDINSVPLKLVEAFGLCGYAISQKGAYKLINSVVPIKDLMLNIEICGSYLRNESLDNFLCAVYRYLNAYICIPPLCVTENDKSKSTMWNGDDFYL
ncbi:glycosyltransferase family 25 protein [Gluconacetobacter sp. Hr-1-5]|uniref:glycosyltransferase family 25 protein n=1 Tax=Gluconacetobacter sp. Hr-1-5 TaxID=3395370 RepID=UPI003B52EBF2